MSDEKYELELELVKRNLELTKLELKLVMRELSVFTKALGNIKSKFEKSNNKVSDEESARRVPVSSLFS